MPKKSSTHWIESRWNVSAENVEPLQTLLTQMGSLGSYEDVPLDDTGNPCPKQQIELIAYFPDTKDLDGLAQKLHVCESAVETPDRASLQNPTSLQILNRIPQGNWATEWKKYFKPFFLTPEIVIRPSWEDYKPVGNEHVITLDPGMAFGTGQHDTTRFCAELICELKRDHLELQSLIDVGCGSGILSIIAKKVGFKDVVGFDIDPASIEACEENLERNEDVGPIQFFVHDMSVRAYGHTPLQKAHVVVANIIAETICELKEQLIALMQPGGFLILSGIMTGREKMIEDCFQVETSGRTSLQFITRKDSADWHAYLYRQK